MMVWYGNRQKCQDLQNPTSSGTVLALMLEAARCDSMLPLTVESVGVWPADCFTSPDGWCRLAFEYIACWPWTKSLLATRVSAVNARWRLHAHLRCPRAIHLLTFKQLAVMCQ